MEYRARADGEVSRLVGRNPAAAATDGLGAPRRSAPRVPDHEMVRQIGSGGYGEVWLARTVLGEYRAVKIVHRSRFAEDRPYEREFEGIQRFEPISRDHPGFVDILQVGRGDAFFYYVMELADDASQAADLDPGRPSAEAELGNQADVPPAETSFSPETYVPKTLRALLRGGDCRPGKEPGGRGALPPGRCIEIGIGLADALAYLHKKNLVHRDIKPSNIVFVKGEPKLADIGLVAAAGEAHTFVGTEGYVAPEGPGTGQADIYALGKVLFEMMTGLGATKHPDVPESWATSSDRQALHELNQVVQRACEHAPKRRYATVERLRAELQLLQDHESVSDRRKREALVKGLVTGMAVAVPALIAGAVLFVITSARRQAAQGTMRTTLWQQRIAQARRPNAGWYDKRYEDLRNATAVLPAGEVAEHLTAALAGLDARIVWNHTDVRASSAAFAADGRVLLGCVHTDAPLLLIGTNGTRMELPTRGPGPVCWDPAATPLQLSSVSNRLVMRNATNGLVAREFAVPDKARTSVGSPSILALTPDASRVAAALGDFLYAWDGSSARSIGERAIGRITALAFSPDGLLLATGAADGTTRVFSVPGLAEFAVLPPLAPGIPILGLAFARDRWRTSTEADGTAPWLLATGDQGAQVAVWDVRNCQCRASWQGSVWLVSILAFSPDASILASAGRNYVELHDTRTGRLLLKIGDQGPSDARVLMFDTTGRGLLCGADGSEDGESKARIGLWSLDIDRSIKVFHGLGSPVRRVWLSADGSRLAAFSDRRELAFWDVTSNRLLGCYLTPAGARYADSAGGCFDATGTNFVFAAGSEATLFAPDAGMAVARWALDRGLSDQVQCADGNRWLLLRREPASQSTNWLWRLYELEPSTRPRLVCEQTDTNRSAFAVSLSPGGRRFLVWLGRKEDTNRTLVLHAYDVAGCVRLCETVAKDFTNDPRVYFDPTGERFGHNADLNRALSLMSIGSPNFVRVGMSARHCAALGPFGEELIFHGENPVVRIPDRNGMARDIPLAVDWSTLGDVSVFNRDGRQLAWGTEEGVVLVADIREVVRRLTQLGCLPAPH